MYSEKTSKKDVPKNILKKTKAKKPQMEKVLKNEGDDSTEEREELELQKLGSLKKCKFPRILPLSHKYNVKTKTSDFFKLIAECQRGIHEKRPDIKPLMYIVAIN